MITKTTSSIKTKAIKKRDKIICSGINKIEIFNYANSRSEYGNAMEKSGPEI